MCFSALIMQNPSVELLAWYINVCLHCQGQHSDSTQFNCLCAFFDLLAPFPQSVNFRKWKKAQMKTRYCRRGVPVTFITSTHLSPALQTPHNPALVFIYKSDRLIDLFNKMQRML